MKELSEWENMFANHLSVKGVISRIYQDPLQLKDKQQQQQFEETEQRPEIFLDTNISENLVCDNGCYLSYQ